MLTVSDQPGYALQGVAINFIKKEGRIRFEINLDTMKAAGITPSSQILKLAHLVKNGWNKKEPKAMVFNSKQVDRHTTPYRFYNSVDLLCYQFLQQQ